MGRSSNRSWIVALDRAALGGLALGLALYVLPFWREGRLRPAFWLTLISTLLHVYTSHARFAAPRPVSGVGPNDPGAATGGVEVGGAVAAGTSGRTDPQ